MIYFSSNRMEKTVNFTSDEVDILVDLYNKYQNILQGKFGSVSGAGLKKKKWNEILEAVNTIGQNNRTIPQLKKKMKNLRQKVKQKASDNKKSFRKTGGGSDDDDEPDEVEDKILATISATQVHGIVGGIDTHYERLVSSETPTSLTCSKAKSVGRTDHEGTDAPRSSYGTSSKLICFQNLLDDDSEAIEIQNENQEARKVSINTSSTKMTKVNSDFSPVGDVSTPDRKRRRLGGEDTPQMQVMREQVEHVKEQTSYLRSIDRSLQQLVEIEREKLNVMKGKLCSQLLLS